MLRPSLTMPVHNILLHTLNNKKELKTKTTSFAADGGSEQHKQLLVDGLQPSNVSMVAVTHPVGEGLRLVEAEARGQQRGLEHEHGQVLDRLVVLVAVRALLQLGDDGVVRVDLKLAPGSSPYSFSQIR